MSLGNAGGSQKFDVAYLVLSGTTTAARCPELLRALVGLGLSKVIALPTPNAARVIAPRELDPSGLQSALLGPALRVLAELVRRLHSLEGPIPLNAWLEHDERDWRLVLLPRLTIIAGLELGAGIFVNTLPPEEAAQRLRG